ncbi:MAG: DUF1638 domain-containing protein [candidate division KSB1 bacterium]|nr:DUF1638 domain-containing protein [candidate division KSB1 bacterium]MDZ7275811.1 DUF1638 domain-containing protein [candidate division KSB1 bacterium]MDZ7287562.1 DUF1638 domain-containing protein [candidate division KSB1 bacterium]MDZ7308034.1 DUF1638 domain-containing protein [candidate division KSB1 bacterium]MDZ7350540.1 DUF1638 domain-containing protein [candidate division KSB1 bacterium]
MKPDLVRAEPSRHLVITCGVLEKELLAWPKREHFHLDFVFLPSSLDLDYDRLEAAITKSLRRAASLQYDKRFVLYGQCHPLITEFVARNGGILLPLGNCFELLLGKEAYQEELAKGTYFLLPQWAGQWNRIFTRKLGFTSDTACLFFPEMHVKALYLDTGFAYQPAFQAQPFTAFTRLPVEFRKVDLRGMHERLHTAFTMLLGSEELDAMSQD